MYRHTRPRRFTLPALTLMLIVLGLLACAPALAAPPPTLDLAGLEAELAASPTGIDGFMKTTMLGTTPENIPVKILAITDGFYFGKLIMFECPDLDEIGGVASGMSGSPIYFDDDANGWDADDPMVGAVSYGDIFTLRGTGLATPIEYMTAMQGKHSSASAKVSAIKLEEPVKTSSGVVRKIVLGGKKAADAAASSTTVMQTLAIAKITGLPAGSPAYKKLAAKLEAGGLRVLSGSGGTASLTTPGLEAGSPCGVVFSTGHYALYALGTVTYVDGDDAVLFGHPVLGWDFGMGPVEGILTGATVDAIWPSTYGPYKMMTAQDAKGSVTQDRSSGMLGQIGGGEPLMFPVTTEARVDEGPWETYETNLGHWFATEYYGGGDAASAIAAMGLYHVLDSEGAGSVATTTTIELIDPTIEVPEGEDPPVTTVTRSNLWDGSYYIGDDAVGDVWTILDSFLYDPYDVRQVQIKSVDVVADFSSERKSATIADISVARALRAGQNLVDVTYYNYHDSEPHTITATLDIPQGASLAGYVWTLPAVDWMHYNDYDEYYYYEEYAGAPARGSARGSGPVTDFDEIKAEIDAMPTNEDVQVVFVSEDEEDEGDPDDLPNASVTGDRVFFGEIEKAITPIYITRAPGTVGFRKPIVVQGIVYPGAGATTAPVKIYCQEAGGAEKLIATVTAKASGKNRPAQFAAVLPGVKSKALITVETPAINDKEWLPGADQVTVKVRAGVTLSAARKGSKLVLTARVTPATTTGKVEFQRKVGNRWVAAGSATLKSGKATHTVANGGVKQVRARFKGGTLNAASDWVTAAVK